MGHRLLVLDDEEPLLFAMREYFAGLGCEVDCAAGLGEAERLLACHRYSAVVADLKLGGRPTEEGLEILGMVRERHPRTPVLVLTAYGSVEIETEARRRGAAAFLLKPKRLSELAQVLFALWRRSA